MLAGGTANGHPFPFTYLLPKEATVFIARTCSERRRDIEILVIQCRFCHNRLVKCVADIIISACWINRPPVKGFGPQWWALCLKSSLYVWMSQGQGRINTILAKWWDATPQRLPLLYLLSRSVHTYGLKYCYKFNQRSLACLSSLYPSFARSFSFNLSKLMDHPCCWRSSNLEHISCFVSI